MKLETFNKNSFDKNKNYSIKDWTLLDVIRKHNIKVFGC